MRNSFESARPLVATRLPTVSPAVAYDLRHVFSRYCYQKRKRTIRPRLSGLLSRHQSMPSVTGTALVTASGAQVAPGHVLVGFRFYQLRLYTAMSLRWPLFRRQPELIVSPVGLPRALLSIDGRDARVTKKKNYPTRKCKRIKIPSFVRASGPVDYYR